MPELKITGVEDLVKLKDWAIESVVVEKSKPPNFFRLRLSHIAAEKDVFLDFKPMVSINVHGNVVTAIPDVGFAVTDAE